MALAHTISNGNGLQMRSLKRMDFFHLRVKLEEVQSASEKQGCVKMVQQLPLALEEVCASMREVRA